MVAIGGPQVGGVVLSGLDQPLKILLGDADGVHAAIVTARVIR